MLQEHAAIIAEEYNVTKRHAAAALRLLDEGCTVAFVSRYRKEATGSMTEDTLRSIQARHAALTALDERKALVVKAVKEAGAMTPEMRERIDACASTTALDDIYQPYRPRRKTRAAAAYDLGLEPLAALIRSQACENPESAAAKHVGPGVPSVAEALAGAMDIIAEQVADDEKARGIVRAKYQRNGTVNSRLAKGVDPEQAKAYQACFDLTEPVRTISPARYLTLRQGEDEGVLKVTVNIDDNDMTDRLTRMFVRSTSTPACASLLRQAVADGYKRLLKPTIETEICAALKERSDTAAISALTDSLHDMLMAPPAQRGRRVLAIDPGFQEGCRVAVLDVQGNLVASDVIYPNAPNNDFYTSTEAVCCLVDRYGIDTIAIGNGTAGRETERFVTGLQLPRRATVNMVNAQGAAEYAASDASAAEMPDVDPGIRTAVTIGRRLLDPMAELIKAEPRSLVAGPQLDQVNQPRLREALDYTVDRCVNAVGVNLNTASAALLSHVSGIGPGLAENIVNHRAANGPFTSREQLMDVPRMGEKTFQQCAAFLRIPESPNPLDNTTIHPEHYPLVWQMAQDMNVPVEKLMRSKSLLQQVDIDSMSSRKLGLPTLNDIIAELANPGRDPRLPVEDETPAQLPGVRSIADLHLGQELVGKVNNITAFGVFVDLGIKENGLIHISQLSDDFVASPHDVVSVGQQVRVRIIDIDVHRGRIALTLKL